MRSRLVSGASALALLVGGATALAGPVHAIVATSPPTITINGVTDGAVYPFFVPVLPSCTAVSTVPDDGTDDTFSDVPCSGTTTSAPGPGGSTVYTYSATATDEGPGGGTAEASASWTVTPFILFPFPPFPTDPTPPLPTPPVDEPTPPVDLPTPPVDLPTPPVPVVTPTVTATPTVTVTPPPVAKPKPKPKPAEKVTFTLGGLPSATKHGHPVIDHTKTYDLTVVIHGKNGKVMKGKPMWLHSVESNKSGKKGKPTDQMDEFTKVDGVWTMSFTPGYDYAGEYRKIGVVAPDGTRHYWVIYVS